MYEFYYHPALYMGCNLISVISCTLCAVLLVRLALVNPYVRTRIFWRQLLALTVAVALTSLIGTIVDFMYLAGFDHGQFGREFCVTRYGIGIYCSYSSCMLEVHIAAGFYAVVYQKVSLLNLLRKTILLTFFISFVWACFDWLLGVKKIFYIWGGGCLWYDHFVYDISIITSFVVSLVFYLVGALGVYNVSSEFSLRVLCSVFVYALSVSGTLGLQAFFDLIGLKAASIRGGAISQVLACLNGFTIACAYGLFAWPILGRNNHAHFARESVHAVSLRREGALNPARFSFEVGPEEFNMDSSTGMSSVGSLREFNFYVP